MSKRKSVTLLTIISVLMAITLVLSFIRFPIGVNDYNSLLGAVKLDYDLAGGISYTLTLNHDNEEEVKDINTVVDSIESRLEQLGYSTFVVKPVKSTDEQVIDKQIRIEVLENTEASTASADEMVIVSAYGELKFYGGTTENPTTRILEDVKVIKDARYVGQNTDGNHVLMFEFTDEGRKGILDAAGSSSSFYLKIVCGIDDHGEEIAWYNNTFDKSNLDNNNKILSMPMTYAYQANGLALLLREGGIQYRYDISDGVQITSPYGEDVGIKCVVAIITLIVIATALIVFAYKGLSAMLALSLLLFILAEGWLLIGIPGIVVSMGSIVGIIASTLVCIISMTILAQRVKEEYANSEKTAKAAINKGFEQAFLPTVNLHVVSGVLALALLIFAKGALYAFAVTFGVGVVVSFIATTVFTRMFNSLVLPLVKDKEKFLAFERAEKAE